jgi:hypothetical protein
MTPPRYLPEEPLPPYAFVPGSRWPHPFSDPAGHSYGSVREHSAAADVSDWRKCRALLRGVDLFNHGYYWEAHEAWEGLWHACGRRGTMANLVKGLIQLAVAGVKHRQGMPEAVRTKARRAAQLWRSCDIPLSERYLGLGVGALIELSERVSRNGWIEAPILHLED